MVEESESETDNMQPDNEDKKEIKAEVCLQI